MCDFCIFRCGRNKDDKNSNVVDKILFILTSIVNTFPNIYYVQIFTMICINFRSVNVGR